MAQIRIWSMHALLERSGVNESARRRRTITMKSNENVGLAPHVSDPSARAHRHGRENVRANDYDHPANSRILMSEAHISHYRRTHMMMMSTYRKHAE